MNISGIPETVFGDSVIGTLDVRTCAEKRLKSVIVSSNTNKHRKLKMG